MARAEPTARFGTTRSAALCEKLNGYVQSMAGTNLALSLVMMIKHSLNILLACLALCVVGCGEVSNPAFETGGGSFGGGGGGFGGGNIGTADVAGGGLGVTPGGQQDIRYAREMIAQGQVPPTEAIRAEGLFSEHHIAAPGAPCESMLCARTAMAVAPSLETGEQSYWLQLGMTSGLAPSADAFNRPPVDLVVLIDRSASMDIDMDETNEAVTAIVDHMRGDDRIGILAYNDSVEEVRALGEISESEKTSINAEVRRINAIGGSNMDLGLSEAYNMLFDAGADDTRLRRVVLLSCGYPYTDGTGNDMFTRIVREGASDGIGLTFLGVLLGFDQNLANTLSQYRGGSYHYVQGLEDLESFFDEDLDLMVSPLAYDLDFKLSLSEGLRVAEAYGIPATEEEDAEEAVRLQVTTAFPSRRGGAILVRLERDDTSPISGDVGSVSLSYRNEPAHGLPANNEGTQSISLEEELSADETHFGGEGVRKAIALTNMATQLRAALESHHGGDSAEALGTLNELRTFLDAEATAMDDEGLATEVELIDALIALIDA